MQIDPEKFKPDESRSNPMVVAIQYPDCPINEICTYMAMGGGIVKQCEYFRTDNVIAECTHGDKVEDQQTTG